MVIAPKKQTNKIRVCVDFRALNKVTIKDGFPMPFCERVLEDVAGHSLYSFMDGFSGYNQIAIHPDHQAKTAFVTPWGTFVYTKMAFGLQNAPPTFNRVVQKTFGPYLLQFLRVFMDDFSNFTGAHCSRPVDCFEEHLHQLSLIFDRCRQVCLKLNPNKCHFLVLQGTLLGHVVLAKGLAPDPDKIVAILRLPPPVNMKDTQSFVGHTGYHRRFV